jgi:hypothetical protein
MKCAVSIVRTRTLPRAEHRRHGVTRQHLYTRGTIVRLNERAYDRKNRGRTHLVLTDKRCIAIQ